MTYIEITKEWVAENLYNGTLPVHAHSYTLLYVTGKGDELCACCALETLTPDEDGDLHEDPAKYVGTYDEGPVLYCENCNAEIVSSYGDPDEPKTAEAWAHQNIEGAESDTIECVWDDSELTIIVNDEEVKTTDYGSAPDSDSLRLSREIDAVNYWYAYGN